MRNCADGDGELSACHMTNIISRGRDNLGAILLNIGATAGGGDM